VSYKKNYQIKCKKITDTFHKKLVDTQNFKTIGAEYATTLRSIDENIDYIMVLYNNHYEILEIIHVSCDNISSDNIIPRKPLSKTAKRAGWQGCYLQFTNFQSVKTAF
jgi:hypothetical protein